MDDADNLIGDLLSSHKNMCVILRKTANAKQTVQRPAHFMAMHQPKLADSKRQITVAVGAAAISQNAAI